MNENEIYDETGLDGDVFLMTSGGDDELDDYLRKIANDEKELRIVREAGDREIWEIREIGLQGFFFGSPSGMAEYVLVRIERNRMSFEGFGKTLDEIRCECLCRDLAFPEEKIRSGDFVGPCTFAEKVWILSGEAER